jgi:excisionase family DNA binding protein
MEDQSFIPEIEPVLLDKEEAASYLHTTERHIERLVEQGALGHCRVGRYVMFRESDLVDYLERSHVEPKEGI